MKKGLTTALMTVAVALLGIQAMAMAPTIHDVPSPVVGNAEAASAPTGFVFPDAFNLNTATAVEDDVTPVGEIKWSYEIVGTPIYNINGVAPINSGTENPTTPGAKQINSQVAGSELNPDNNPATLTVRNVHLSPLSGSGAAAGANVDGAIPAETQAVTFYASDGSTYSQKTVFFYTDNGGSDRLSKQAGPTLVKNIAFTGTATNNFIYSTFGGVTSSVNSGICMQTGLDGNNYALWSGPAGDVPLVKNAVYHVRAKVNGSVTSPNTAPFWDIVVDNASNDGATGINLYGYDYMFFDNEGGASAANSANKSFHLYFAPLAVATAQWNDASTGAFTTALAGGSPAQNSARIYFRVMDVTSNGGIHANTAAGTLCLTDLVIERWDLSQMTTVQNVYSVTNFVQATQNSTNGTSIVQGFVSPTISFAGGKIAITAGTTGAAGSTGRDADLITIDPGKNLQYDTAVEATIVDKYPVPWTSDTLYQITTDLSVPDANGETNPWDEILIGMDSPTQELIMSSFVTAAKLTNNPVTCAMPKQTAQTFMQFYWTHKESASAVSWFHALRPRVSLINHQTLTVGNNSGTVVINNIKVNKVTFQGAAQ